MIVVNSLSDLLKVVEAATAKVILVYGPTASGKSTISNMLVKRLKRKGYSVPIVNNKESAIPLDMFYRDAAPQIGELLGMNFDNPLLIDHKEAAEKIVELYDRRKTRIPRYCFCSDGRVGTLDVKLSQEGRAIIVAEGIYAHVLKSMLPDDLPSLTVYVTPESQLELLARRIIRDTDRLKNTPLDDITRISTRALETYETYVKNEKPDIMFVNNWSILESRGIKTFQVKVPLYGIEHLLKNLYVDRTVHAEDLMVRDPFYENISLRFRLFWDMTLYIPKSAELAYRKKSEELTIEWRINIPTSTFSDFITMAYIITGKAPERFPRNIAELRKIEYYSSDSITIKVYRDREIAEIVSKDETNLRKFLSDNNIREYMVMSYYDLH